MPLTNGKFEPLELPSKHARVLFDNSKKWRYRVLRGGRNGAKDWSMTAACVERAIRIPTRFLFTREVQLTIKASSHQLIKDTITRLGYKEYFTITNSEIKCNINDSYFIFRGLNDISSPDLKSMEGIDVCVICEAQNLTKKSFVDLDPTIRRAGSEIWIQFNEQFDDDFVYQFCVVNPPENLICEQVLYTDNPWTSPEIYEQAERMRREDPILFRNVWLGECLGQGGRVLPMFSKTVHLIDFDHTFLPQCDLYMSIDPHRKYYPAIGWSAVTPTGCLIDYNEWPKKEDLGMWYDEARNVKQFDMSIKELANIILANDMTNAYGGKVIARTCDPRFAAENPDFIRALMENGVMGWVTAPYERIETQRENFKQLMAYNPNIPIVGANAPGYYVDRDCSNIIRANLHHCWTQDKDKEAETHKDFIDRMRYLLSIMDGKPKFGERRTVQPIGEIKSLANQMLSGMPAQGYFRTPKK